MRLQSPWTSRLSELSESPSERLMLALADDILSGKLPTGSRLPPQRDVADILHIGLGSVTRAYAILERRGLIRIETGRGCFVALRHARRVDTVDLSVNTPPAMLSEPVLAQTLATISRQVDPTLLSRYGPAAGHDEHRRQMAQWLPDGGIHAQPQNILLCNGAQQALCIALAVLCKPGTVVVTETLTYPGAVTIAHQQGYRLHGLDLDDGGARTESLEAALRTLSALNQRAVVYLTPTLHNPTTRTMSARRRREVAKLCRTYDAMIIEDQTYAMAPASALPSIASFAPERTFCVTGMSKTLSPGLRIGALVAPDGLVAESVNVLRALGMMAAPLSCAIMAQWLTDGTADLMAGSMRAEIRRRTALASTILETTAGLIDPDAIHLWLPLTRDDAQRAHAMCAGVTVTTPSRVMVDPDAASSGLRLCIGAAPLPALEEALNKVSDILQSVRPAVSCLTREG
ncbi:PLP-dependent aminotransferase family protein [Burkholderia sp. BCC0419]|uniref:aminotransferase-like domain-containing protein n=1 Tax=Burkholderia sp. BCC0419 TaxID=486878 RepID=UPI00158E1A05|nr:PLP-dependent aminotransferase family protein [Burkholderia sp. BCC0419]